MAKMTREDETVFWNTVQECLVRFHGLDESSARSMIEDLRGRLKSAPSWADQNLIYHNEPFNLACDMTGRTVDFEKHRGEYLEILKAAS